MAKAKGLAEILGASKAPPPPDSDPSMSDEDDSTSPEEVAAMKELLAAIKSGDPTVGAVALKNFMKECGY